MASIFFTLVLIVALFTFLQNIPQTKLANRPKILLSNGFVRARYDLATRFFAHSVCITVPLTIIGLLPIAEMAFCTTTFAALGVLIPPELRLNSDSELVVTKSLFGSCAEIHLRNPYQSFTRRTYQELLRLVEYLPDKGIKRLKLTSPMFYRADGTLREFSTLEKLLAPKNAILSSYKAKPWRNLLGQLSMIVDGGKAKKEKISNINLNKWHVLDIQISKNRN